MNPVLNDVPHAATRPGPAPLSAPAAGVAGRSPSRALAAFAVAGPVLCATALVGVQVVSARRPTPLELGVESVGLLLVVVVNVLAGRLLGRRLTEVQADLAQQVHAREATEQRLVRAVTDLTQREAFLSALLETMDVEVVAVDAEGTSVVWNGASRAAYGVDRPEDVGPPDTWAARFGLHAADGVTPLRPTELPLLRALSGESVRGAEIVTVLPGGRSRTVQVHAAPICLPTGQIVGALSAGHDVTVLRSQQAELIRRNRDLDAVGRATSALLTGTDARAAVCQAAREVSGALAVMLFEPDASGERLVAVQTAGLALPPISVPVDHGSLTAQTFRLARTQMTADVLADEVVDKGIVSLFHAVPGGEQMRSAVFLPVVYGGRTRAVLVVTREQPLALGDMRLLALLELLAGDAALALAREDLSHDLERQAVTDPLTGLGNRRRWDTDTPREITRAARTGAPLSVVMLDLDHFKAYNDSRGHTEGDALLVSVAAAWQRLLRADDVLVRMGGEEFAVLLRDCGAEDAARLAAGLLRCVPNGQTCSAGVAEWAGDTPEQLLTRADSALYRAKAEGRDRVCVAGSPTPVLAAVPVLTGS